jgi:hypothetical protein
VVLRSAPCEVVIGFMSATDLRPRSKNFQNFIYPKYSGGQGNNILICLRIYWTKWIEEIVNFAGNICFLMKSFSWQICWENNVFQSEENNIFKSEMIWFITACNIMIKQYLDGSCQQTVTHVTGMNNHSIYYDTTCFLNSCRVLKVWTWHKISTKTEYPGMLQSIIWNI